MSTNRRRFLASAFVTGLGAALPETSRAGSKFKPDTPLNTRYKTLDEIAKQPVFKKQFFTSPVIIDTIELLRDRENFLVRVRS